MRKRTRPARQPTIKFRLVMLVAAVAVPLLALSTFMLVRYSTEQRDRYLLQLQATARAISQAIDARIEREQSLIRALLATPELRQDNWQAFHDIAKMAVAGEAGAWVTLYDPSGRAFMASDRPLGEDLAPTAVPEVIRQVVETRQQVVSGIATRRSSGEQFVGVFSPVFEDDGTLAHVIVVAIPAHAISELLHEKPLAVRGVTGVVDRNGVLLARSTAEEEFVGKPASPDLLATVRERDEGVYESRSLEGLPLRGGFAKSPLTGWTVALGAEQAALNAPLRSTLIQFGGGAAALLLLALALATQQGSRIARPVTALTRMAQALGRGEPIPNYPMNLAEAQITADAIHGAAAQLQARIAERERIAEMTRRDRDLLVNYAISSAAERSLDLQQRLEICVQATLNALGMPAGAIYLMDPSGESLTLRASSGYSHELVARAATLGLGDCATTVGKSIQICASCPTPCPMRPAMEQAGLQTLAGVPIIADRQLLGLLTLAAPTAREFPADELSLLEAIGHQLGAFISHAKLYHQARNEIAERERAQAQLEAARDDLESFAHSVSHDLRAPLRAIEGFSRILQEDYGEKLDAEGNRVINVVRDSTRRMAKMIDDILAFSRVGRAALKVGPVDMQAAVQNVMFDVAPALAGRQVEFQVADLPPAQGDAAMLQQVWANLLGNAVKYTAPRDHAIIEIGTKSADGTLSYFVRDNGVGFDMRYVDKLFGTFQRLHGSEFPGTGVGLSIVKRIIKRHGGRVWAEGEVDKGATFFFSLGRNSAAEDTPDMAAHNADDLDTPVTEHA
jgi:signal transduction histidine kinase